MMMRRKKGTLHGPPLLDAISRLHTEEFAMGFMAISLFGIDTKDCESYDKALKSARQMVKNREKNP